MPTAARLPSPTLSMIRRGPNTQSPPAKIPGSRGHQRLRIHRDQPARREFNLVFRRQESRDAAPARSP